MNIPYGTIASLKEKASQNFEKMLLVTRKCVVQNDKEISIVTISNTDCSTCQLSLFVRKNTPLNALELIHNLF
uniref:Uncharacterized protein n=1 Tax=Arion vulgaris TaxID=1028688 RepID=A0A0B6ZTT3_9EUPU